MVDASEKLSNDHAYDAQGFGLPNKLSEFFEHGLQAGALGEFESLADMLVKRFAQGSACQLAIASAAALLQSADEMEVAELHDPALVRAELDNPGNLVGDRGPDPSVNGGGNGCECLRPTLQVLSAWLEHRIEKDRSILMDWLDRHHIQHPIFPSKAEIKPIQEQNQRSSWQAQSPWSRYELSLGSTKTPTEALTSKPVGWGKTLQCASVQQRGLENSATHALRLAPSPFLANSPCTLALTALTTSRTEVINLGSATGRFRVA
jgi:hypothetical protein